MPWAILIPAIKARWRATIQDGTLDATFGNGGKVITAANVRESAAGLLLLPDGKIVICGSVDLPSSQDTSFVLLRYNSDGSVDSTFGSSGMVVTNIGDKDDQAYALALQSNGKIVAAGRRGLQIEPAQQRKGNVALARYNPDGSLDTTFGSGGKVINDFGQGLESYAIALRIQPDDKIVIAGESSYEFLAARYNPNGTLDPNFGGNGFRLVNFSSNWDGATDLLLQPDGKIVLVGWSELNSPYDSFALARLNPDGSFDPSFGSGGKVLLVNQGDLNAVVRQSDGKLLAVGSGNFTNDTTFRLLRFKEDGSLDSTFGNGGTVTTDFGQPTEGVALAFQPDGKLVLGGTTSPNPYFQGSDFALARYDVGTMQMIGAASRKTHGRAGAFDIPLTFTGAPAVECRSSAGEHSLVFTFNHNLVDGHASMITGTATIDGKPSYTGNTLTVHLTGVADAQTITLTLSEVTDTAGHAMPPLNVRLQMLAGDVSGNGIVNATDVAQTKGEIGASVTASNFRADVTANGSISSSDLGAVKAASGGATIFHP